MPRLKNAWAPDSPELWVEQRTRASAYGKKALVIIGASRIQLGLDMQVLRDNLPLEPIQLAVDGASWVSLLKGLAEDERVRGTVLIDYYDHTVKNGLVDDVVAEYQRTYEAQVIHPTGWAVTTDAELAKYVRRYLRSYADGARPLTSLHRALGKAAFPQYLQTFPDRSRAADYQLVPMPSFYYARALTHAGIKTSFSKTVTDKELEALLQESIEQVKKQPVNDAAFLDHARVIHGWIEQIRARGGNVLFVRMPVSGFVRQFDEASYPRELFFDRFGEITGARMIHFLDDPSMATLTCPDGSHLDYRDKRAFTLALVHRIKEANIAE